MEFQMRLVHRHGSSSHVQIFLVHLRRSAWALSWERHAPAWLLEPGWSPAFPAKALTQQVLRKCTRHATTPGNVGGGRQEPAMAQRRGAAEMQCRSHDSRRVARV